jgi:hypothetical protein
MRPSSEPPSAVRPATAPGQGRGVGTWTHARFFDLLGDLGPLRVISIAGASTFEAIVRFGPHGFAHGHMNAITPAYHWHVALARFRHVRSCDELHERSGRRVLFFELREEAAAEPFLRIYLYREKGVDFEPGPEAAFAAAHAELAAGVSLAPAASAP